ncbi:hypothetical protein [Thermaerobacter composti]|uniref:ADP-ribosylglycohydrolase n=1 Tax=Thermaerobacter composti TaxID=554949 RepID=A0ABZ0QQ89_9FIRM|nr:hypothetical protein [Thermaerobacter composti]WPD19636.1 hypothetical protein Q5761_02905 [Thermaerobacter composti]
MTPVESAEGTARRIRDALWGLACGEAVGRWAAAGGAVTAGGPARAGGWVEGAFRPGGDGPGGPDPSALEAGPLALEVAALARAVVAAEGQVGPMAVGARPVGTGLGPAVRAVLAGLINRPDDVEWLVQDVAALATGEGGTGAGLAGGPAADERAPQQGGAGPVAAAALAAAAAVAAAVSAAVEGEGPEAVLDRAVTAASVAVGWAAPHPGQGGARRGDHPAAGTASRPRAAPVPGDEPAAAVAHAIETLRLTLACRGAALPPGGIAAVLASRWEPEPRPARAVPFALVLAAAAGDARRAVLEAAAAASSTARPGNAELDGRPADAASATAALAGAVAGALYPGTVPAEWVAALREGSGGGSRAPLELDDLVPELLRLR